MTPLSLPASSVVATVLWTLSLALLASGQCPRGKFGPDCRFSCHCRDDSACDAKSGACDEGCHGHYSGPSCQRRNAALGAPAEMTDIRSSSGRRTCPEITDGVNSTCCYLPWYPERSLHILMYSSEILSHVVLSGDDPRFISSGRWIQAMSENGRCITMPPNESNQSITFRCDGTGRDLIFRFLSERVRELCELEVFVCSKGFYGETCSLLCGHCKNDACNQETGTCSHGCQAGYAGNHCNETCDPGTYGQNCTNACGRCTSTKSCNHVDGTCSDGCEAGYAGSHCDEPCAPTTFGQSCSNVCGYCRHGKACNHEDGTCSDGCEAGYAGSHCNETCARETYGEACSLPCPPCHSGMACHHVTGSCPQEAERFVVGLGVGLPAGLVLATLVLVGAWLARKRGCGIQGRPPPAPGLASPSPLQEVCYEALDPGTREAPNLYESTSASPAKEESYEALDGGTREAPNLYEETQETYENTGFSAGTAKSK